MTTYFVERRFGNSHEWMPVGESQSKAYAVDLAEEQVRLGFICRIIEAKVLRPNTDPWT